MVSIKDNGVTGILYPKKGDSCDRGNRSVSVNFYSMKTSLNFKFLINRLMSSKL